MKSKLTERCITCGKPCCRRQCRVCFCKKGYSPGRRRHAKEYKEKRRLELGEKNENKII